MRTNECGTAAPTLLSVTAQSVAGQVVASAKALMTVAGNLLMTWQERHSQRRHLSTLSDRLLKDIGLSRADIEHEIEKPFWRR
ncbi:MAG TPA: DUF1127 domain-containing protein [Azospirillaceae bacterium]|nr:DUF1127 domain-containing protein [Azospirillaceae bacterium]